MTTAFHTDVRYAEHTLPGHPEHAGRLTAIVDRLNALELTPRLMAVEGREATQDELLAVHTREHLMLLQRIADMSRPVMIGADTYALPVSYELARRAAGGVMSVVDAVLEGRTSNGLAVVRPPGHHATPEQAMGFCLVNNIAIAARYAQQKHSVERVAIVDFDVHHGNGTQDAFYEDGSVLFISSHQSPLYPGTGHLDEIGQGEGRGANINMPVPPGTGDGSFLKLYEEVAFPALERFKPGLFLISAGFDAHWRDPLANLEISLAAFARLARLLIAEAGKICDGRIVFVTEGGYDLEALSFGVANAVFALLGEGVVHDPLGSTQHDHPLDTLIQRLCKIHQIK